MNLSKVFGVLVGAFFVVACDSGYGDSPTVAPTAISVTVTARPTSPVPTAVGTVAPSATGLASTPTTTPAPTPTITVGTSTYRVEVARTPDQQALGLGQRDSLPLGAGMLFPEERERTPAFWMKGMRFALDFVWIGANCTVADLTVNVPPPESPSQTNLPIYSPSKPVLYVFEINAGQVAAKGLKVGDAVRFDGSGMSDLGCFRP